MFHKFYLCIAALGLSALCAGGTASAESSYPNRPLRLIIPFAPGGATDVVGRLAASELSNQLGQRVVAENRGGAGGALGTALVASAKADGYTLGVATVSTQVTNPSVMTLDYDPNKDLIPIVSLAAVPNIIFINPEVPAKNMQEFIQLVKAEPGKYTFASAGVGSVNHIICETFLALTKTKMRHVPYKGAAPALTDLMAGRVTAECDQVTSIIPLVKAGKIRALAIAAPTRLKELPDVPTFKEVGLPDMNTMVWYGLMVPAGTPPEIVDRINAAYNAGLKNEKFLAALEKASAIPTGGTQRYFQDAIQSDLGRVQRIVKEQNITIK